MTSSVVVTNISPLLELAHLKELFECCGAIKNIDLKDLGNDTKMCTIEYSEPAHAKAASFLTGTPLGERNLDVKLKGEGPPVPVLAPVTSSGSSGSNAPQAALDFAAKMAQQAAEAQAAGIGAAAQAELAATSSALPLLPSATFAQNLANVPLPTPLLMASQKRAEECSRTIYIGNVSPQGTETQVRKFFENCGEILYVKLAGDASPSATQRYAFVEFSTIQSVDEALKLTGTMMGDRIIKVGKANNPIQKTNSTLSDPNKIENAMRKVREAQARINSKVVSPSRSKSKSKSRSRSRSRGRKKSRRSRSRDRSRRRRSRSRSRDRSRRSRRSRSRDRGRGRRGGYRDRDRSPPPRKVKKKDPHEGMFWDGFQWNPRPELLAAAAVQGVPVPGMPGAPV